MTHRIYQPTRISPEPLRPFNVRIRLQVHGGTQKNATHMEPPWEAFLIPFTSACSSVKPTLEISGMVQRVSGAPASVAKMDSARSRRICSLVR